MADRATLGPKLGHFLPYLLRRRLRAVAWPADGGERAAFLLILGLMLLYGAGFGFVLNASAHGENLAGTLPKLVLGLNAGVLLSALLVDFLPALRPVARPVPEHFPVSARLNAVAASLLDFITFRRLTLLAGLLAVALVAPRHGTVPGFALLLLLAATALSFNVRLLLALRRWRHPLMGLHFINLGLMAWWLSRPEAAHHTALGWGAVLLPCALWAVQLYWLGPFFSARYLPTETGTATVSNQVLARLAPEWKAYIRKTWLPLLMGLGLKIVLVTAAGLLFNQSGKPSAMNSAYFFYLAFLPAVGFNYVNNNLFGYLGPLVANELQRLGLTPRVLWLYARVVGPVVLVDCLLSAVLLLALFPASQRHLLALLPLGAAAFTSVGLWGSLYHAKPVVKAVGFGNLRNNTSKLVSVCTVALAALLYFLPWWWPRILIAALVTVWAVWPVQAVFRNDGSLRRRLWRGIGA